MVVCVCKNINEDKIIKELNKGLNPKEIIKKFECLQCKLCIPFIIKMYRERRVDSKYLTDKQIEIEDLMGLFKMRGVRDKLPDSELKEKIKAQISVGKEIAYEISINDTLWGCLDLTEI